MDEYTKMQQPSENPMTTAQTTPQPNPTVPPTGMPSQPTAPQQPQQSQGMQNQPIQFQQNADIPHTPILEQPIAPQQPQGMPTQSIPPQRYWNAPANAPIPPQNPYPQNMYQQTQQQPQQPYAPIPPQFPQQQMPMPNQQNNMEKKILIALRVVTILIAVFFLYCVVSDVISYRTGHYNQTPQQTEVVNQTDGENPFTPYGNQSQQ